MLLTGTHGNGSEKICISGTGMRARIVTGQWRKGIDKCYKIPAQYSLFCVTTNVYAPTISFWAIFRCCYNFD